jgi:hypothetical protein
MRRLCLTLAFLAAVAVPALAAEKRPPSAAQLAQQERMRSCSTSAKEKSLHGDPRKAFMKECLSRRVAAG